MNVFREEFEETQKSYKKVIKVLEKAPMGEVAATNENDNS